MYQAAHWVSTHSLPLGDSNDSPTHEASRISEGVGEKKGKKEVSFSLDDDEKEGEGDPDTSGSLGSVFSSPTTAAPDNNNLVSAASARIFALGEKMSVSVWCYPSLVSRCRCVCGLLRLNECYLAFDGTSYYMYMGQSMPIYI